MPAERSYYRVEEGSEASVAIEKFNDARMNINNLFLEFAHKCSGSGYLYNARDGELLSIKFDTTPGREWRKSGDGYVPNKRYKDGVEIRKHWPTYKIPGGSALAKLLGFGHYNGVFLPMESGFGMRLISGVGMEVIDGVTYITGYEFYKECVPPHSLLPGLIQIQPKEYYNAKKEPDHHAND